MKPTFYCQIATTSWFLPLFYVQFSDSVKFVWLRILPSLFSSYWHCKLQFQCAPFSITFVAPHFQVSDSSAVKAVYCEAFRFSVLFLSTLINQNWLSSCSLAVSVRYSAFVCSRFVFRNHLICRIKWQTGCNVTVWSWMQHNFLVCYTLIRRAQRNTVHQSFSHLSHYIPFCFFVGSDLIKAYCNESIRIVLFLSYLTWLTWFILWTIGADLIWNRTVQFWSYRQSDDTEHYRASDTNYHDTSEQYLFPVVSYPNESSDGCCSDRNSSDFYLFRTTILWKVVVSNYSEHS